MTVGSVGSALVWFSERPEFESWPVLVQLSLRDLRQPKVGAFTYPGNLKASHSIGFRPLLKKKEKKCNIMQGTRKKYAEKRNKSNGFFSRIKLLPRALTAVGTGGRGFQPTSAQLVVAVPLKSLCQTVFQTMSGPIQDVIQFAAVTSDGCEQVLIPAHNSAIHASADVTCLPVTSGRDLAATDGRIRAAAR